MKLDAKGLRNTVREKRVIRGMRQDDLAGKTGVSRQTIISIEKGMYNPSVLLALKIAAALQVPVEDLFTLDEETQQGETK